MNTGSIMGEVPVVAIYRRMGPLSKDPYNEDGRPPTLLLMMALPYVQHTGRAVIIEGLEKPNLCWAGKLVPPYTNGYKPLRGVKYMDAKQNKEGELRPFVLLRRQRILLF
jgi:hypothetical protein